MSWLFGDNGSEIRRIRGEAWLHHRNAYDQCVNDSISKVDWPLKRKLDAKKKLTKKEEQQLFWINMKLDSYKVQEAIHDSLAHQYGDSLGLF